jgi:hypothetical protein
MENRQSMLVFPLLAMALLALLAAGWIGLLRIGWRWPPLPLQSLVAHGPLMVSAFLGTVIGIERAVALGKGWTYTGPLLTALGGLALLVAAPRPTAQVLITLGSVGLVLVFVPILRYHTANFTVAMALGAVTWLVGNLLWLAGSPIFAAVPWWAAFLLLTVAGERLELSRILRPSRNVQLAFAGACAVAIAGLVVSLADFDLGMRLFGLGMLALALWLWRFDVARRTVRLTGITRFIAACLLSGYVWLGISGVLYMWHGGVRAGPIYDAVLHSFFLGFVFAMLFGHATIIIPAVLHTPVSYHPLFYVHLTLLNVSLVLRVAGDLMLSPPLRKWGGVLNAVAILLFIAATVLAVRFAPPEDFDRPA